MTVTQQPEGIGQRACGGKVLSLKDLQLYQPNQNAKIGFRALLVAPNYTIRFHLGPLEAIHAFFLSAVISIATPPVRKHG